MLVHVLAATLLLQLLANVQEKQQMTQKTWAPATHTGALKEVLGSWLCHGSALAIAPPGGANQWLQDSVVSLLPNSSK